MTRATDHKVGRPGRLLFVCLPGDTSEPLLYVLMFGSGNLDRETSIFLRRYFEDMASLREEKEKGFWVGATLARHSSAESG